MSSEQTIARSSPISGGPPQRKRILVLDDEIAIQRLLTVILEGEGYEVLHADDGRGALETIEKPGVDLIIQDLRMPKMDGLTFLRMLKDKHPDIPSIVLTAFGTMDTAVEAMRLGAYTHLSKPFDTEEIRMIVGRALERIEISRRTPRGNAPFLDIISNTKLMSNISSLINRVAPSDATILITGESGTGKELVARGLHYSSLRNDQAFVAVNCGAFTETLLESELFGHVKGAFTNAIAEHEGVFKCADRGTLFLDEVGELTLQTQVKLLRVLETRSFKPVGSQRETRVDVRFITATNRNLAHMVAEGQFREDLFYRLNVIPIELPPLRERKEDIPLLAGHFLAKFAKRMNKKVAAIDDAVIAKFLTHSWPGNVRELENTIERAVALARQDRITLDDVSRPGAAASRPPVSKVERMHAFTTDMPSRSFEPAKVTPLPNLSRATAVPSVSVQLPPEGMDLEKFLLHQERLLIIQALERTNWSLTEAAKILNMTFRSIRYRVSKLGIERPGKAFAEE